jgi:outer membrane protein
VARKEIEVQRAARSPQVDLVGNHSYSRSDGDYDSDSHDTSLGLQLSMPLWLGGSVSLATDQSRLRFDQAKDQLEQQQRSVSRQVRDAYRGVLAGISAVRALEAGVVSAQSALEATQAGFEVGTRTMVDVLNAERDLYSVKSNHAAARYQYVLAGLQLKQAAGILSEEDLAKINGWLR